MTNDLKLPDKGITNYQSTYSVKKPLIQMEFTQRKQEQLLKKLQQAHRP
jgi:hypothetical protein